MGLWKLAATTLAIATACSSASGAFMPDADTDRHGLAAHLKASTKASVRYASSRKSRKDLSSLSSLGPIHRTFAQTATYGECTSADEATFDAYEACINCIVEKTCDETTCPGKDIPGQLLICPTGQCCVRAILDSEDSLNALLIDGQVYENGELVSSTACSPCGLTFLECATFSVPDEDAGVGAEVECADSSTRTAAPVTTSDFAPKTAAPETAAPVVPATAAPAPVTAAPDVTGTASTSGTVSTEGPGLCFPSDASVEIEHGGVVRMDALAIGDSVKVGPNQFSKVFIFTHKMADVSVDFVVIRTASGAALTLTNGHYIYANDALVAAGTVLVGDELMLGNGQRSSVTSVSHAAGRGLYNPQTLNGDIVVNGVVASTYTTSVNPGFAHVLLAPLRALSLFGLRYSGFESGGGDLIAYAPRGVATIA